MHDKLATSIGDFNEIVSITEMITHENILTGNLIMARRTSVEGTETSKKKYIYKIYLIT